MRGNIGAWLFALFAISVSGQALAIERKAYSIIPRFEETLTWTMQKLAEEMEIHDENIERSKIYRDLVSHGNKFNPKRPLGDEVRLTTYSAPPAPPIVLRFKAYRSVKNPLLSNDRYFRVLRKRRGLSHFSSERLIKLWSQAILHVLAPIVAQTNSETPWIITITDEQKIKKGISPYPTAVMTGLTLEITTPRGIRFRFDRTTPYESALQMGSLILEVVREGESFASQDTHWLRFLPGKRAALARARRFLDYQETSREELYAASKGICADLLKPDSDQK